MTRMFRMNALGLDHLCLQKKKKKKKGLCPGYDTAFSDYVSVVEL